MFHCLGCEQLISVDSTQSFWKYIDLSLLFLLYLTKNVKVYITRYPMANHDETDWNFNPHALRPPSIVSWESITNPVASIRPNTSVTYSKTILIGSFDYLNICHLLWWCLVFASFSHLGKGNGWHSSWNLILSASLVFLLLIYWIKRFLGILFR